MGTIRIFTNNEYLDYFPEIMENIAKAVSLLPNPEWIKLLVFDGKEEMDQKMPKIKEILDA